MRHFGTIFRFNGGSFTTRHFGTVNVIKSTYPNGELAVELMAASGVITVLSVI